LHFPYPICGEFELELEVIGGLGIDIMVPPFQMFILEGAGIEVNREWRDSHNNGASVSMG
jgi:hypothetical protein